MPALDPAIVAALESNFNLGASVILSAYLTGKLDKRGSKAILERLKSDILAGRPELEG